jgi:hypothetical protein
MTQRPTDGARCEGEGGVVIWAEKNCLYQKFKKWLFLVIKRKSKILEAKVLGEKTITTPSLGGGNVFIYLLIHNAWNL